MKISLILILQLIAFSVFGQTRVMTKTYEDFQTLQHIDAQGKKGYHSESDI